MQAKQFFCAGLTRDDTDTRFEEVFHVDDSFWFGFSSRRHVQFDCRCFGAAGFTPTPSISRALLVYNQGKKECLADGIVVTPSHNPPSDGGFKYNPPQGGPADTDITDWMQQRANDLLRGGNRAVKRISRGAALQASTTREADFVTPYVEALAAAAQKQALKALQPKAVGAKELAGEPILAKLTRARISAASRSSRAAAGLPCAPRAPRIYVKSTLKAFIPQST
jgi:phosphoglucomutase